MFFALDLALWATAVMRSASTLANNKPFFVGLMSWLILGRRPRAPFWIGPALALAASVFFAAYLMMTDRGQHH